MTTAAVTAVSPTVSRSSYPLRTTRSTIYNSLSRLFLIYTARKHEQLPSKMFTTLQYSNLDNIIFEGPPKSLSRPKKSRRAQLSAHEPPLSDLTQAHEGEAAAQGQGDSCSNADNNILRDDGGTCLQDMFDFSDDDDALFTHGVFSQLDQSERRIEGGTSIDPVVGQTESNTPSDLVPSFGSVFRLVFADTSQMIHFLVRTGSL